MTLKEKLEFLEEIMDLDEGTLSPDTVLEDIEEWDSLSRLSLTAMMKNKYNIELKATTMMDFVTINDVCNVIPNQEA